jgi:hypothetical protein
MSRGRIIREDEVFQANQNHVNFQVYLRMFGGSGIQPSPMRTSQDHEIKKFEKLKGTLVKKNFEQTKGMLPEIRRRIIQKLKELGNFQEIPEEKPDIIEQETTRIIFTDVAEERLKKHFRELYLYAFSLET